MLGFYSIVLTLYLFIAFVELKPILKKTLHFNLITSSLRSPCVSVCPTKSHHDLQNKVSFNVFQYNTGQEQNKHSFNVFQYYRLQEENRESLNVFRDNTVQEQNKDSFNYFRDNISQKQDMYSFNGFQYNTGQEENKEEDLNVEDVFQESTIQQLKNSTQFYVKKVCGFS
jgi:hypothetical protein